MPGTSSIVEKTRSVSDSRLVEVHEVRVVHVGERSKPLLEIGRATRG